MAKPNENQTATFPAAAEAALFKGNKIDAIKIVRVEHDVDLKEAKDIVEHYVATHPGLQMQIENVKALSRRQLLPWLMAVIVIGTLVIFFLAVGR